MSPCRVVRTTKPLKPIHSLVASQKRESEAKTYQINVVCRTSNTAAYSGVYSNNNNNPTQSIYLKLIRSLRMEEKTVSTSSWDAIYIKIYVIFIVHIPTKILRHIAQTHTHHGASQAAPQRGSVDRTSTDDTQTAQQYRAGCSRGRGTKSGPSLQKFPRRQDDREAWE